MSSFCWTSLPDTSVTRISKTKRIGFYPWVTKIPWRTAWQPTPVFLGGESHGQRSLVGCSPWVAQSWTWLKWLSTHAYTHAMIQLTSLSKEKELTRREGIQTEHFRSVTSLARAWLWLPSSFWTPAVRQPRLWPEEELCLPDVGRCLCDSRDSMLPPLTHRQAW